MKNAWKTWGPIISRQICEPIQASNVIDLGDKLRPLMYNAYEKKENPTLSETQSMKSTSGVLWESLLVWYCNLCLIGTRSVVMRKNKQLVPKQFLEAISTNYGIKKEDSEADLIVLTFPNHSDFLDNVKKNGRSALKKLVDTHFGDFELGIISCKTPWNDFSVIPKHWNLVYRLTLEHPDVLDEQIGTDTFNIRNLKKFYYAFATLPSQKPDIIKSDGLPVLRLMDLSGGTYWGLPSKEGIAKSMKEFFEKNISHMKDEDLSNLEKELPKLSTHYPYFNL